MNQITIIGRFAREVKTTTTSDQSVVLNNTVAVTKKFKGEQTVQTADFIPVVAWNHTATLIAKYCEKGTLVGITGRMQSRSYLNKEEEKVFVLELVIEDIQFLSRKLKAEETEANE